MLQLLCLHCSLCPTLAVATGRQYSKRHNDHTLLSVWKSSTAESNEVLYYYCRSSNTAAFRHRYLAHAYESTSSRVKMFPFPFLIESRRKVPAHRVASRFLRTLSRGKMSIEYRTTITCPPYIGSRLNVPRTSSSVQISSVHRVVAKCPPYIEKRPNVPRTSSSVQMSPVYREASKCTTYIEKGPNVPRTSSSAQMSPVYRVVAKCPPYIEKRPNVPRISSRGKMSPVHREASKCPPYIE